MGVGWIARCPAHDERHPSLSIQDGNNGGVLMRCHAGCDRMRVIGTLGGAAIRTRLAQAFGKDIPAAFLEDAIAVGGAILIVSRFA